MIEPIGDWVVRRGLPSGRRCGATGPRPGGPSQPVAAQLWQPNRDAQPCWSTIDVVGLDPTRVMVEVTESAAMTEPTARRSAIIAELHEHGLKLAIDDFGTGYSSLARLHSDARQHAQDRPLVRPRRAGRPRAPARWSDASSRWPTASACTPLAEGIETDAQRRFLVEHGCPQGQGFLFAAGAGRPDRRPLSPLQRSGLITPAGRRRARPARRSGRRPATSSVCVPRSTIRPLSSTRIRSASRTVESRWAMVMVVRPRLRFRARPGRRARSRRRARWWPRRASAPAGRAGSLGRSPAAASRRPRSGSHVRRRWCRSRSRGSSVVVDVGGLGGRFDLLQGRAGLREPRFSRTVPWNR